MLRTILACCLWLVPIIPNLAVAKSTAPNVIVIFCDDLGYGELPAYRKLYQGSEAFDTAIGSFTPHMDRLAGKGVLCTRAYGNNTCAPARMSLLSGKWPNRSVALGGQPMIGRAMREAGLKTAHYGKYHHDVEKEITIPHHQKFLEFDEFMGFEAMMDYFKAVGARIPKPNPDYDPKIYKEEKEYRERMALGSFEGRRPLDPDEKPAAQAAKDK